MTTAKALYQRWINELSAGKPVAAELVADDFVGHWPDREVNGPDELQAVVDETQKMFSDLMFVIEIEPFVDRDLVARPLGRHRSDGRRSGAVHRERHPAVRERPVRRVLDGHLHRLASTCLDRSVKLS